MTIKWEFLVQSIREGHWLLLPALVLFLCLSLAFGMLVFRLLDVRFITIPDRFAAYSPETVLEQVWKDFATGLSFLLQTSVRIMLAALGFCGVMLPCSAVLNLLSGGIVFNFTNAPDRYNWLDPLLAGAILGLPPFVFALYTHANDLRKRLTRPVEIPPEPAAEEAYAAGTSRMTPRLVSLFQAGISLGFFGWIFSGIWILVAAGRNGLQVVGWTLSAGRFVPPSALLLLGMPTAVGWLLILAGGFLSFFFRSAFIEKPAGTSLQRYLSFRTITSMATGAVIGIAIVYSPWPGPLQSVAIAVLFFIMLYFQLSAIGSANIWARAFAVLFGTFLGMNGLHGIGFRIGILPFFFFFAFLYRIYPDVLEMLRERRHDRKPVP